MPDSKLRRPPGGFNDPVYLRQHVRVLEAKLQKCQQERRHYKWLASHYKRVWRLATR